MPRLQPHRIPQGEEVNIYQRINEVRKRVAYLKKDKQVENYKAVSNDQVVSETRQWFVDLGILVLPSVVPGAVTLDTGARTQKGNIGWRYEGHFVVEFVNVDDPTDRISVEVDAHANDYGDKAPGKALSYATKSAVLKVLYLETGENDEAREVMNLAPRDVVDDEEWASLLGAVQTAETEAALAEAFGKAFCRVTKDKAKKAELDDAKKVRKLVLAAEKKGK